MLLFRGNTLRHSVSRAGRLEKGIRVHSGTSPNTCRWLPIQYFNGEELVSHEFFHLDTR